MYAASTMCAVSYGVEALKNTDTGSTLVILPWLSVYPAGEFIHEFAATTDMAPRIPDTTIGIPLHQCAQGGSRSPPVQVHPDEDRFQEEEDSLQREREADRRPEPAHQARPQQAHLVRQHGPRHRADRHQHRHDLRPAARQQHRRGIAAPDADPLRGHGDGRERDAEAREDDVEPQRRPHLRPGRHRIHGQNVRHCAHRAPPSAACPHRGCKAVTLCVPPPRSGYTWEHPQRSPRGASGI